MNVSTSWPTPQLPRHEMTDNFSYIGIVPKITSIREKNYTAWIAAFLSSAMQISSSTEEKTFFLSSFLSSKEIDDLPSPFFFSCGDAFRHPLDDGDGNLYVKNRRQ